MAVVEELMVAEIDKSGNCFYKIKVASDIYNCPLELKKIILLCDVGWRLIYFSPQVVSTRSMRLSDGGNVIDSGSYLLLLSVTVTRLVRSDQFISSQAEHSISSDVSDDGNTIEDGTFLLRRRLA